MADLAGAVVWAVVPFVPQAPFRIYAGSGRDPYEVAEPARIVDAARKGSDAEFTFLTPAKARPILVLSDRADPQLRERLGLRLLTLDKLDDEEQAEVRDQRHERLFHLKPETFDLPSENAAMIAALVRVHETAIAGKPVGQLDKNELRVVHERVARYYDLDLNALVRTEIQRLAKKQAERGGA